MLLSMLDGDFDDLDDLVVVSAVYPDMDKVTVQSLTFILNKGYGVR